jgi:putative SOS response-associated peptidase YedK
VESGRRKEAAVSDPHEGPFTLWHEWTIGTLGAPGEEILTFTILTTSANALMKDIHERMPLIIQPEQYKTWLDPQLTEVSKIQALTTPFPEQLMEAYPVGTKVNNPKNDGPELLEQFIQD